MPTYRAQGLSGIAGSGVRMPVAGPDYGSAIDAIANAFLNTRESIIRRAVLQQQAQRAQQDQARQDAALQLQQEHLKLQQAAEERASADAHMKAIAAGYKLQDPNAPVSAEGELQPTMKLNGQSYVLDPTATPEARKKAEKDTEWQAQRKSLIAAGIDESKVDAARGNDALIKEWLNPTPRAPVYGSDEYLKAVDRVESVRDKHQQGAGGGKSSTATGKPKAITALNAPMAAKVGQYGEMMKKLADIYPLMDQLDVGVGSSAAQDIAEHGIGVGSARIPGTKGVGSVLLNRSAPYATYQAALSPFILAAAHALSGARINQDQVAQIRNSIEIKPGDGPQVREQKRRNLKDLVNSIGGALPQDAVAEQEGQMDAGAMARLRQQGYQPHGEVSAAPARTQGETPKQATFKAKAMEIQAAHDAAVARGVDPAAAQKRYEQLMDKLRRESK